MRLILVFAFSCLAAVQALAQEPQALDFEALNRSLTERVTVPAYERLAAATARLDEATRGFCDEPTEARLRVAEAAFHETMDAWQWAQPIAFGPVAEAGRAARIQFWPDKGGTASRQIKRALAARDPALIAAGGLVGKSAGLQNLAAYERILFGRGAAIASGQDPYACSLAAAIARFQAALAADILADWTAPGGHREAVLTAAQGNAHYADAEEAATQYLKSLSGTLDLIVRLKLERPLGKTVEKARPRRAESWRSARSLRNIIANLETAQTLYIAPGGFGDLLTAAGVEPLDIGLRTGIDAALDLARSIDVPFHEAIADPEARVKLLDLLNRLKSLRLLISGPLAEEIGLVVGFNALDGD